MIGTYIKSEGTVKATNNKTVKDTNKLEKLLNKIH